MKYLKSFFGRKDANAWVPVALAVITFFVYWPSLKSDFVYDGHVEIIDEGFITSFSNVPAVLSLKVLNSNLMLGDRPGQLLYLMLNAALWGEEPWGYHLSSNLLHAANVALLFLILRLLIATELSGLSADEMLKVQFAIVVATLIFALHPLAVEPVSAINYSSDLLVTFFTFLALLAAITFRPDNLRTATLAGCAGALSAFAAVTCKESGLTAAFLLVVYWFVFRRGETKGPWLLFLGASMAVTLLFVAAIFFFAPHDKAPLSYLGGSFSQVFLIQPRLWVFMMGKLIWPVQLSADYTLENVNGISTPLALSILLVVVLLQGWLAAKSRIGALGVALYWLGLATVSNFMPLYRILADRFYYLPMAGMAVQLLALLLMTVRSRFGFWMASASLLGALLPLAQLTLAREQVFADDLSLWSDTIQVSPRSSTAYNNLGWAFFQKGQIDTAMIQYQKALEIKPDFPEARNNFGTTLLKSGHVDEALAQYGLALELNPNYAAAHFNVGDALIQKGEVDAAMLQYQKALEINPNNASAHNDLGFALFKKGRVDEAMLEFQNALALKPDYAEAHNNLGAAYFKMGRMEEAVVQFQEVMRLKPDDTNAQKNLAKVEAMARRASEPK